VLDKRGETERIGDSWYHIARGYPRGVDVSIQAKVSGPPDERDAELERLRAEVAAYRATTASTKPDAAPADPEIDVPLVGPREPDNGTEPNSPPDGAYGTPVGGPAGRAVNLRRA
jgi:hypothetical protein